MLSIPGNRVVDCDGITRREFMRVGGAGMLGLGAWAALFASSVSEGVPRRQRASASGIGFGRR